MINLLAADWIKMFKGKKVPIVFGLFILLPLIQVATSMLNVHYGSELILAKDIVIDGASGILMMKKNAFMIYSITCALTSFFIFIGEEFQYGTIRNTLALGQSRSRYYFSKFITISTISLFGMGLMTVVGMLAYGAAFGFGQIPEVENYIGYAFQVMVVQVLLIIANIAVFVMIVFIFKQVGLSLLWMFIYIVGTGFAPGVFQNTTHFKFLTDWFVEALFLYSDFSLQQTIERFPFMILVSLATIVVSLVIGVQLFKRSDIK